MLPLHSRPLAVLAAAAVLVAAPVDARACGLFNWFHKDRTTTFYAPVVAAAPACNTCVPQTVSYVPQTAFRPVVTTTPVTTMRPVTATDPCTGCPTTVLQRTTGYVQQTMMVPYTSYRPVVAPTTTFFAPAVAAPATTTFYQPAVPAVTAPAVTVPAQPGCCGTSSVAPTTFATPVTSTQRVPLPATVTTQSAPAQVAAPAQPAPANTFAPRTLPASETPAERQNTLKPLPIPDATKETNTNGDELPRLLDPQDRTAANAVRHANYLPVALNARQEVNTAKPVLTDDLDDNGWQAAR